MPPVVQIESPPRAVGLPLKLTRRLRGKQWQLEDSLNPQNPQKRVAGYNWVRE